jgi:Tetratricopeptide repeat
LALVNLAIVQLRLRKLKDARASIERALAISEEAYGPDHRKVIKALIDLGIVRRGKVAKYLISIFLVLMSGSARHNPEGQ